MNNLFVKLSKFLVFSYFGLFLINSNVFANITYDNPVGSDIGLPASYKLYGYYTTGFAFCKMKNSDPVSSQYKNVPEQPVYRCVSDCNTSNPHFVQTSSTKVLERVQCTDPAILGCTDQNSSNYDPEVTSDDGSCLPCTDGAFDGCSQQGCTAFGGYWNDTHCVDPVQGCTEPFSVNYNELANIDDGSCFECGFGDNGSLLGNCSPSGCSFYNGFWDNVLNSCRLPDQLGCTDDEAVNYDPNANTGSNQEYCQYCQSSSLQYCNTGESCSSAGGVWLNNSCVANNNGDDEDFILSGDIKIQIPNGELYYNNTPLSPNYYSGLEQSCLYYNSSGLCEKWRIDFSKDFLEFLLNSPWKIGLFLLFSFTLFAGVYRLFLYFKSLIFGKK